MSDIKIKIPPDDNSLQDKRLNDIILKTPGEEQNTVSALSKTSERVTEVEMSILNQLFADKKYDDCLTQAKIFASKDPSCVGVQLIMARAALPANQPDLAFAILLNLLKTKPENPLVHHLLSDAYLHVSKLKKSLYHAKLSCGKNNDIHFFIHTIVIYYKLGYFDEAIKEFQIKKLLNENIELNYNISFCLLANKQYQLGWQHYESRLLMPSFNDAYVKSSRPYWDGSKNISGKKLLVMYEQGNGDIIQFIRFLPLLKKITQAHIYFYCNNSLKSILNKNLSIDKIFTDEDTKIEHDYKIYLLSLPLFLGIYHESQFLTSPYIEADAESTEQWHKHLKDIKSFKIGICWKGGGVYLSKKERDCSLDKFIQLLENPHYQLISLQKEITPEESEILHFAGIPNLAENLNDFGVTAAVIANLDLVISVDTAVAHLAGAMGKTVWTLIRWETEWRHPRDCDVSPWYPSMRLFRQKKPDDWDSVMTAVTEALAKLCPPSGDADENH